MTVDWCLPHLLFLSCHVLLVLQVSLEWIAWTLVAILPPSTTLWVKKQERRLESQKQRLTSTTINSKRNYAPIREVDSSNTTIGMNLNSKRLHIVSSIRPTCEIWQVELDLVPSLIQTHWHCANERLHSSCGLVVWCTKPPLDALVIEYLYLKCEILFEILDNHYKEWKLDTKSLLWIRGANNVTRWNIRPHNLEDRALNVLICYPFNVPIFHFGVPNLKRLRSDRIENG